MHVNFRSVLENKITLLILFYDHVFVTKGDITVD